MCRKWNHENFWGKQGPNLCKHALAKANIWKIQKPHCDVFYFVNVSVLLYEKFNYKDALGTCHDDVECVNDMSSRVLVMVAFYPKNNYLVNE